MLVTLAGAMSTAELGLSLAEMIRQDKVHAICCTGANLEEDIFNLVAHDHYERVPHYRDLTPADEQALLERHMNRVTDTCIPEEEAMRRIETAVLERLGRAPTSAGERYFPHEFMYEILRERHARRSTTRSIRRTRWMLAAAEKNLPMFVPGWEDSTLGNMFAGALHRRRREERPHRAHRHRVHDRRSPSWYTTTTREAARSASSRSAAASPATSRSASCRCCTRTCSATDVPLWGYFCQISDSTTSYGSYSGAVPNEKITWGKLGADTPKFIIESDATIVAPLMFAYVLGW